MCGLTSQVLARDFKAGGHPDLISAAKLLQRFLALDFAVIYCHLFLATPFISRTFTAHYGRQIFSCAAQVRFLFFGEALRARRTFGAEATPMCHDDIRYQYQLPCVPYFNHTTLYMSSSKSYYLMKPSRSPSQSSPMAAD